MKRSRALLSALLALHLATASHPSPAAADGPVRIGVLATFSGDFAKFGELVRSGVIAGAKPGVEFAYEDEGCAPAQAVNAIHKLLDIDGISLFIGPSCGSSQHAVAPLLKTKDALALFAASAPAEIFKESGGHAFSTQYSIEQESAFNATAIDALGYKSVAILATASEFSRAHEAAFRAHFKGRVVESLLFPKLDKEAVRAGVLRIKRLNPDALYVPDASPFFYGLKTQLRQTGLGALPVFSVYSAQSSDMLKAEGEAANGLMYSYPDIGENDAVNYFPKVAAELLTEAALQCGGAARCVRERLQSSGKFDANGTLQGKLVLRVVRDGRFGASVPIPE